jgi:Ca-activated chloride channel homolog
LSKSEAERAIVVMSDGEGFEQPEEVLAEARRAAEAGTSIITVGFGTEQGATIPVRENGVMTQKRDKTGAVVITRYSPDLLKAAAEAGNGVFVPPTDPDRAASVRQVLAQLRTEQRSLTRGTNLAQRFQLFLVPGLVLLLLDTFLSSRRGRKRELTAVGTAASSVMMMFLNGCSLFNNPEEDAIRLYNRGTAMLARADSMKLAVPILNQAERAGNAEVKYRAGFNAGFIHLTEGLALKGDSVEVPLDSALAVYKRVLTLRPDDLDAKWNYELALRQKKSGGGGGGGGGGGNNPQPQPEPSNAQNEAPRPRPIPGMTPQRAEQILNSMEQEEQDVQGRKQRKSVPTPPPNGKDW